jgi:hypothetical protein
VAGTAPDGSPVDLYALLPDAALREAGLRLDRWLDYERGWFVAV